MKRFGRWGSTLLLLVTALSTRATITPGQDTLPKTLLIFFDGLRPDYITPDLMPNLYKFRNAGFYGSHHHSVYPTLTRVNATSYSTGSYPMNNGIMGNEVFFPGIDSSHSLNTAVGALLDSIKVHTADHLVTAISLGEALQAVGSKLFIFSDGSQGQAYLQNHKLSGGAIIHTEMIRPDSLKPSVIAALGPQPAYEDLNRPRHKWITDAYFRFGLTAEEPLVSAIWYADPDETAHGKGIGAPMTNECLRVIDHEFGRILDTLKARRLDGSVNILISSDHGFVTRVGTDAHWPQPLLIEKGLKKDKDSDDVVFADGAIYVKDHDPERIRQIVAVLQEQDFIGGVFTKAEWPGSLYGWVPGTLSLDAVHWNHPDRAADILVTDYWDDKKNTYGYAGTSYYGGGPGSHGGFSPYEVNIALIAGGPSFKRATRSTLPTSNVDLIPTILHLYHLPVPTSSQGRIMYEILKHTPMPSADKVVKDTIRASAPIKGGKYEMMLERSIYGTHQYLNYTRVVRGR